MSKGMVYTEIHNWETREVERWFYGIYDMDRANEVAYELGHDREQGIFHCATSMDNYKKLNILNLPNGL